MQDFSKVIMGLRNKCISCQYYLLMSLQSFNIPDPIFRNSPKIIVGLLSDWTLALLFMHSIIGHYRLHEMVIIRQYMNDNSRNPQYDKVGHETLAGPVIIMDYSGKGHAR